MDKKEIFGNYVKYLAATVNLALCAIRSFAKMKHKQIEVKRIKIHRSLSLENVPSETEFRRLTDWLKQHGKMRYYFIVSALGLTRRQALESYNSESTIQPKSRR